MKNILLIVALLFSTNSIAIQADVVTFSKTVAATATPEALSASNLKSTNVIIQAKSTNTATALIGPCSGTQDVELAPGSSITVSNVIQNKGEQQVNLNSICLKVGVNGEGANVLYTIITD